MRLDKTFAWVLLSACLIAWPISQMTWASNEPPTTLGLSWLAMIFVAYDILRGEQRNT